MAKGRTRRDSNRSESNRSESKRSETIRSEPESLAAMISDISAPEMAVSRPSSLADTDAAAALPADQSLTNADRETLDESGREVERGRKEDESRRDTQDAKVASEETAALDSDPTTTRTGASSIPAPHRLRQRFQSQRSPSQKSIPHRQPTAQSPQVVTSKAVASKAVASNRSGKAVVPGRRTAPASTTGERSREQRSSDRVVASRARSELPMVSVDDLTPGRRKSWMRRSIGFVSSTALHAIVLIALGLLTLSLPTLDVWSVDGRVTSAEPPRPEELEFDPGVTVSAATSSLEQFSSPPETMPTITADLLPQAISPIAGTGELRGPVAAIAEAEGLNREIEMRERGAKGTAEFFGVQARGHAFVYVVDCSDSMAGGRLKRALYELQRSIENLAADQLFYVIMFDGGAHPMLSQEYPDLEMLSANEVNRIRFKRWLRSVDVGDSTRPRQALQLALYLEPDAIFLLSDGEFQDNSVVFLRENNPSDEVKQQGGDGTPIHTICFESRIGERTLSTIANDHGGTFRFIP